MTKREGAREKRPPQGRKRVAETKVGAGDASRTPVMAAGPAKRKKAGPRAFRLDAVRLAAARRVLGTPNDTATIDAALDYVVFGRELRAAAESLEGMTFDALDHDAEM